MRADVGDDYFGRGLVVKIVVRVACADLSGFGETRGGFFVSPRPASGVNYRLPALLLWANARATLIKINARRSGRYEGNWFSIRLRRSSADVFASGRRSAGTFAGLQARLSGFISRCSLVASFHSRRTDSVIR